MSGFGVFKLLLVSRSFLKRRTQPFNSFSFLSLSGMGKKTVVVETYDHRDLTNTKHFFNQGMKWKKKHVEIDEGTFEFLKMLMGGPYSNVRISLGEHDMLNEYETTTAWKHVLLHM